MLEKIQRFSMVENASKMPISKILTTKVHSIGRKTIRNVDNAAYGGVQYANGPVTLSDRQKETFKNIDRQTEGKADQTPKK